MIITQLSVFLENKPGRLFDVTDALAESGIDISALSLSDTAEYGVLRLILSNPEKAKQIISDLGVVVKTTKTLAVAIDDIPGGMANFLKIFNDNGLDVRYMYACVGRVSGKALMVVKLSDTEKGEAILKEKGLDNLKPTDIYRI